MTTPCSASSSAIRERGVERKIDVVAQEEVAARGRLAEGREAVAAGPRRLENLRVVAQVERAAHVATSTSSRVAATSARPSASSGVSAVAMT